MPPCLIGVETCVGAHHLSRKLQALIPAFLPPGTPSESDFLPNTKKLK